MSIDGVLAVFAFVAASRLRFQEPAVSAFVMRAWTTAPLVALCQLTSLGAVRAYVPRPSINWLLRVVAGAAAGTAVAALILGLSTQFEGVSRSALAGDAILLSVTAVGWRCVWVLRARARDRAPVGRETGDLIDRTTETTTFGSMMFGLFDYQELIKNLVLKDLKLKYRGSVFGFLWSLANPLLMVVVYAVAFTQILGIRSKGFVFYVLLGQLTWTFFATSALMATGAIVDNSGLIKSVRFPRAILPIATVLFNLAQFLLTSAVLVPLLMMWFGVSPAMPIMAFPVFLALHVVFCIGVALILATSTVFFRDVRHLLEVLLAIMFWTTPIVYELQRIPSSALRFAIMLSPMSPFVVAYHDLFFFGVWPDATIWLVAVVYSLAAFAAGAMLVLAFEDQFTEQL
jgi:ABC-2 type transport system permease protein